MPSKTFRNSVNAFSVDKWLGKLGAAFSQMPCLRSITTSAIEDIWAKEHISGKNELIYVRAGRARLRIAGKNLDIGPDDIMLVPVGMPHRDVRISPGPYEIMQVNYDWPAGQELLRSLDVAQLLSLSLQARLHLQLLVHELEREYLSEHSDALERTSAVLGELLLACARFCRQRAQAAAPNRSLRRRKQLASDVRQFLRDNYVLPLGLEQLAEQFDVSTFHLSRLFSREFGMSITDTLATIRMERARELLADGTMSVKQISAAVGYSNSNYFAKVFRRYYGVAPSEFEQEA